MLASRTGLLGGSRTLVISANQTNYNLHTALGSPGGAVRATVIINSGVVISSNAAGTPAFNEGALAAGSSIVLLNNGRIAGMGGGGGNGGESGHMFYSGFPGTQVNGAGTAGAAGGTALRLTAPTTIVNGAGEIFGGGGGGGGVGGATGWIFSDSWYVLAFPGNAGGGGQGANTSAGGTAGSITNYTDFEGIPPSNGATGSSSGAGNGGAAYDPGSGGTAGVLVGAGGNGGAWGAAGGAGTLTSFSLPEWEYENIAAVGAGGAGGKAVDLNGFAVVWVSGNDGSRVKGAVS